MCRKLMLLLSFLFLVPAALAQEPINEGDVPVILPSNQVHRYGLYGFNNDFNTVCVNNTSEYCSMPPATYARAKELGFGWQRHARSWFLDNPVRGEFDLATADYAVKSAKESGIKTWISIGGAPAWATGGAPWGETFHCMWPTPPNNYRTDLPECVNASAYPIDKEAYRAFVHEMVSRFPEVSHFSFGNEFHNPVFWPPAYGKTEEEGHRSAIEQVFRPAYDETKATNPRALVVGPDEDSLDSLELFLRLEAEGIAKGEPPLFDVISIHLYGRVEDIVWAYGHRLLPIMDQYGRGRELWITEFGFRTNSDPDPAVSAKAQADWFAAVLPVFQKELGKSYTNGWRLTKLFVYRLSDGRRANGEGYPWDYGILYGDADYTPRDAAIVFQNAISAKPFIP